MIATYMILILFAGLVFGGIGLYMLGRLGPGGITTSTIVSSQQSGTLVLNLPLRFTFTNAFTGGVLAGATVKVLCDTGSPSDCGLPGTTFSSGTTSSSGIWNTTKSYVSGTNYRIDYNDGANTLWQAAFQVPLARATSDTYLPLTYSIIKYGTITITAQSPKGVSLTSTSSYNVTTLAWGTPFRISVQARQSTANRGFPGTFTDVRPSPPRTLGMVAVIYVSITGFSTLKALITDWTKYISYQTSAYYAKILPDDAVNMQQRSDGTYVTSGAVNLDFTMDTTGDSSGNSVSNYDIVYIYFYSYLDINYWKLNAASTNSEAVTSASAYWNIRS
jgi:hypothetical protein